MEHRDAIKLNENLKKATEALQGIGKELAKMQHPTAYSSQEPENNVEHIQWAIPVDMDWESPNITGEASIHKLPDDSVVVEIVFSGEMGARMNELLMTDPVEKLLISSMAPTE